MNLHLWHDNIKMDVKERYLDFRLNSSIPHGWGVGKVGFLEKLMPLF